MRLTAKQTAAVLIRDAVEAINSEALGFVPTEKQWLRIEDQVAKVAGRVMDRIDNLIDSDVYPGDLESMK